MKTLYSKDKISNIF